VVEAAVKAARLIGDGLYGVDLKETERGPLVIEINDNPSIDLGVEDAVLKDELYRIILAEFIRRLEARLEPGRHFHVHANSNGLGSGSGHANGQGNGQGGGLGNGGGQSGGDAPGESDGQRLDGQSAPVPEAAPLDVEDALASLATRAKE
jgi:hypothetical protein